MTEKLLQFIWQFQYFNKSGLATSDGEPLQILFAGQYNTNQGPDFLNAKLKIGETTWAGSVELHLKSSDWVRHKHSEDKNYDNVILHVVWEQDKELQGLSQRFPVLELNTSVSKILLTRYESLMNAGSFIPCEKMLNEVKQITWRSWKDRLLAERLSRKAMVAGLMLQKNKQHWEETFWWMLAKNFGAKVNSEAFEAIAVSLPVTLLAKHKSQIHQLEALLLGQAGLLNEKWKDEYALLLQREYRFLKEKYNLQPIKQAVHFLRMRPGNFPTIRLAQLAALIHNSGHLFSKIKEAKEVSELKKMFAVTANDYWHYHYKIDKETSYRKKELGNNMIENIIINTICPIIFAYGIYQQEEKHKSKSLKWLEKIAAENNSITNGFVNLGIDNKNAFDSQALIELKNEYCTKKKCLSCSIGNSLLKN
ncbi:MAG TPA: DUF2851 family protein [Chitinophagaceae bacterium]|jgi:hypothetical protein|nr:DUF2851 family protein [Chitinophagaceae bacterium]